MILKDEMRTNHRMPMFVGTTAALIGAGVGALGSVAGAAIQSGAAGEAQKAQTAASERAIQAQREQQAQALQFLEQQRTDLQPFREAALGATQELQGLSDPNSLIFQAQRERGTEQIQRQLAAQGLLRSTAQGDQLSNLEVGIDQNRAQILQALSGNGAPGQFAGVAGQQAGAAAGFGQQLGASFNQQGQIAAQGALNQGKIASGGLSQVGNIFQATLDSQNKMKQREAYLKLLGGGGSGTVDAFAGVGDIPQKPGSHFFGGF